MEELLEPSRCRGGSREAAIEFGPDKVEGLPRTRRYQRRRIIEETVQLVGEGYSCHLFLEKFQRVGLALAGLKYSLVGGCQSVLRQQQSWFDFVRSDSSSSSHKDQQR